MPSKTKASKAGTRSLPVSLPWETELAEDLEAPSLLDGSPRGRQTKILYRKTVTATSCLNGERKTDEKNLLEK